MQVSLYEIYLISKVDFERKFEYENYSENKLLFFYTLTIFPICIKQQKISTFKNVFNVLQ